MRARTAEPELGARFTYDVSRFARTDPTLLLGAESDRIAAAVQAPAGVAAGSDGRIYIAGADGLEVRERDGVLMRTIPLGAPGRCVAVAADGSVYVGLDDHVEVFDPAGARRAVWAALGTQARLTSIAVGTRDVFVADAGNRVVHRFDLAGRAVGRIAGEASAGGGPGFLVPSPYFDVALGPGEALWIVNPGALRVARYTFAGQREAVWGQGGMAAEGFCGCCNPTHIAIRPDGAFVTSEKGLPRVKLYAADGRFLGVVAGPEAFAPRTVGLDLAVDATGRVLVLDPAAGCVRVFKIRE